MSQQDSPHLCERCCLDEAKIEANFGFVDLGERRILIFSFALCEACHEQAKKEFEALRP